VGASGRIGVAGRVGALPGAALEGQGWFQRFQPELMKACQPQEQQLLNKYQAQTLCAKVKAIYESAGKENGEFSSFLSLRAFLTRDSKAACLDRSTLTSS
jgi:hypothetical protein